MQILVINSGSSSIKFQIIQMPEAKVVCKGLAERIGLDNAKIHYQAGKHSVSKSYALSNHKDSLTAINQLLMDTKIGVLQHPDNINVVAHRIVHGGNKFDKTTVINASVLTEIHRLSSLAPLHNPANVTGVEVATELYKKATQIAIFDTAFHQSIPEKAYRYAIPKQLANENHIRLYGFHGTSHKYVSEQAIAYLQKPKSNIISIHLGNGCSITAIKNGKSIDHSLGFGPCNGLVMGTRSGDVDQSVIFYLMDSLQLSSQEVNQMLQKESGFIGLTGFSDLRDIESEAEKGNIDCQLALHLAAYRIKKYIGSYTAALNGLDTIIFTAGIGENSSTLRAMVCENLDVFGVQIDKAKNEMKQSGLTEIQKEGAKVKILVIPTNEELEIAKQAYLLSTDK